MARSSKVVFGLLLFSLISTHAYATGDLKLNAGGGSVDQNDLSWVQDAYFTKGLSKSISSRLGHEGVYSSIRYGRNFSYRLPVANGDYTVKLHFNSDNRLRLLKYSEMSILAENEVLIEKFKPTRHPDQIDNTVILEKNITVKDRFLDLSFTSIRSLAHVSGIEFELVSEIDDGGSGTQGPKGDKGDAGSQGPKGEAGPKGDTGTVDVEALKAATNEALRNKGFIRIETTLDDNQRRTTESFALSELLNTVEIDCRPVHYNPNTKAQGTGFANYIFTLGTSTENGNVITLEPSSAANFSSGLNLIVTFENSIVTLSFRHTLPPFRGDIIRHSCNVNIW